MPYKRTFQVNMYPGKGFFGESVAILFFSIHKTRESYERIPRTRYLTVQPHEKINEPVDCFRKIDVPVSLHACLPRVVGLQGESVSLIPSIRFGSERRTKNQSVNLLPKIRALRIQRL